MACSVGDRLFGQRRPEPPRYPYLAALIDQQKLKGALKVLIHSARRAGQPLHHFLIVGPQGMGKASFASAAAREVGTQPQILPQGAGADPIALLHVLLNLPLRSVLIIEHMDELPPQSLNVIVDCVRRPAPRVMLRDATHGRWTRWDLPQVTIAGTAEKLPEELWRVGDQLLTFFLEPYQPRDLEQILQLSAIAANIPLEPRAAESIVMHSRGTPEQALDILCSMWRVLMPTAGEKIQASAARSALQRLGYS